MSVLKRSLLLAALLVLIPASVAAANTKLTFENVVLTDGDGTQTTGVIEAGVKEVNKGTFVTCSYFSADHVEYLGELDAADPAIDVDDAGAVQAFCVTNFPNRAPGA